MARNLNEDEEKEDNLLRGVESTFKLDFGRLEQVQKFGVPRKV